MKEKINPKFYARLLAILLLTAVLLPTVLFAAGCSQTASSISEDLQEQLPVSGTDLKVNFIDVGQGDSTLIEKDGHFMLIDAGEKDQGEKVVSYLKDQGVKTLDYVVATHPHSDHIGGMEAVIEAFDVEKVIMPEKEHTTKTYENLLDAIEKKEIKIAISVPGDTYQLGGASFQILAPVKDYGDELNNWSVGLRLVNGKNSFLFCGDAEKEAEEDMEASGYELKSDVLKVSHHGSSTSSTQEFIERVNPAYAVISCGKNNDYGHPNKETLERLENQGTEVFRTDQLGTIVAVSNGENISFSEQDEQTKQTEQTQQTEESTSTVQEYIINESTKKFHLPSCTSAANIKAENKKTYTGTREEMLDMGYEPCKICNP